MTTRLRSATLALTAALSGSALACSSPYVQVRGPGGILGLIWLVLVIYAIVKILQGSGSPGNKALWIVLILLLPVVGLILWFLLGRK